MLWGYCGEKNSMVKRSAYDCWFPEKIGWLKTIVESKKGGETRGGGKESKGGCFLLGG